MPTSPASDETPDTSGPVPSTSEEPAPPPEPAGEVDTLREELASSQDRYRRALADLDNYRKRVERDGDRRAAETRRALLREWLEAVDSVERALSLEPDDSGLSAVLEQMEAILARHGAQRIDAVGTPFDPQRHEAIAVLPAVDVPDHTVLEVARSGFDLGDGDILRPALVVVAQHPAGHS